MLSLASLTAGGTIVPVPPFLISLTPDRHDHAGQRPHFPYDGAIGTIVPDKEVEMTLADDVRTQRKALGLGQIELAELAAVSERFVRSVEQGKATVRLDKLTSLLDVLGLELRAEPRRGVGA